jgi:modulator of FtsH protease
LEFVLLFAVIGFRKRAPLNLFLLYGFTFMTGFVLGPLLGHLIGVGKGGIIGEAFLLTAVGFFGLTWFSMVTKRDFTGLGKFLIVALLILIAASILNLFLQAPMLQLAIAAGGAILFSIFVIYDTQQIIRGNVETPIEGAIMLYLDFLNLFLSLLQLLDND